MNNRGVTLIEVLSVATMVTIVGGISLVSLKKNQINSRKIEGKTELGILYQAQETYLFKNRAAFHDGIEGLVFPRGKKRFNIGYAAHSGAPKHNYKELYAGGSADFEFIVNHNESSFNIPGAPATKCPSGTNKRIFTAYAIGHIKDGDIPNDPNKLSQWSIDQDGALDEVHDPL